MSKTTDVPIQTTRIVNLLDPTLAAQIRQFQIRLGAMHSGYPVLTGWHPVIPERWGEFPRLPFRRSVIYRGNAESWAYSHHQTVARFQDRYVAAWSNGLLHEDYVGQEVHFAHSPDGRSWSEPRAVVATPVESALVRFNAGLYADDERLFCYVGVAKDFGRDVAAPGMNMLKENHIHLDVYETTDLAHWTHYDGICNNVVLYEGPRRTRGGRLVCCGFDCYDRHGLVLIWDNASRPADRPRVVHLALSPDGVVPLEGTWYETDDGRIWMFQRDGNMSGRLGLTFSDDEGDSWSDLLLTDFPNSSSRAFAGRLGDGRCYIVGNNYDRFLDRMALQIAVSDDGRVFDRQYTLVDGPTTRRVNGRHKENGYHYPNCCADGDKLLVIYSVNKEDIEIGTVDVSEIG